MKEIEAQLQAGIEEKLQNYNDRQKEKESRVDILEERLKALRDDKAD